MIRNEAMRRAARGLSGLAPWSTGWLRRARLAVRDWRDVRASRTASLAPSLRERQEELIRFYDRFEDLVEVLCDSAQYGPDGRLEQRYEEVRLWMQASYPSVRRFVSAYLRFEPEDAARSLDVHGQGRDAFEALFAANTLDEFLRSDDGRMIERIGRTREALGKYGDHLRHLIAQERSA